MTGLRRALALATATVACSAASAHGAPALHGCGSIADPDAPHDVRVRGVSCHTGRALAEAHWLVSGRFDACAGHRRSCRVRGYTCRRTRLGGDRFRVRCAARAKVVRFRYDS